MQMARCEVFKKKQGSLDRIIRSGNTIRKVSVLTVAFALFQILIVSLGRIAMFVARHRSMRRLHLVAFGLRRFPSRIVARSRCGGLLVWNAGRDRLL